MYTLRKILPTGEELNFNLGNVYTVILKTSCPDKFDTTLNSIFQGINEDSTYAFVSTEDAKEIYPLYKGQWNYIMTDSGKTFSNLTLK